MPDILKKDGLSLEILKKLSYHSELGINLKRNLHYFDREALFAELEKVNTWYDTVDFLHDLTVDYRIKSIQSARLKYARYYPDRQAGKTFNDMLGSVLCVMAMKRYWHYVLIPICVLRTCQRGNLLMMDIEVYMPIFK